MALWGGGIGNISLYRSEGKRVITNVTFVLLDLLIYTIFGFIFLVLKMGPLKITLHNGREVNF